MSRLEQLTKLHQADPKDPFCTYGIALEVAKTNDFDGAIRWLDKTLQLDPRYCYAYFQKAKMLMEKGEDDSARQVIQEGMKAATEAGDAHAREELATLLESI